MKQVQHVGAELAGTVEVADQNTQGSNDTQHGLLTQLRALLHRFERPHETGLQLGLQRRHDGRVQRQRSHRPRNMCMLLLFADRDEHASKVLRGGPHQEA
jgi:hypothetical protein